MNRREAIKSGLVVITASVFAGGLAKMIAFDPGTTWCVEWQRVYDAMGEKPEMEIAEAANKLILGSFI